MCCFFPILFQFFQVGCVTKNLTILLETWHLLQVTNFSLFFTSKNDRKNGEMRRSCLFWRFNSRNLSIKSKTRGLYYTVANWLLINVFHGHSVVMLGNLHVDDTNFCVSFFSMHLFFCLSSLHGQTFSYSHIYVTNLVHVWMCVLYLAAAPVWMCATFCSRKHCYMHLLHLRYLVCFSKSQRHYKTLD